MITIFSCPKPFHGHIDIIQHNAFKSWTLLRPTPEIILMGNEEGTAQICKEFGIDQIVEVERNRFGTPLVNDLFAKAEKAARNPLMCYVNTDIILLTDFLQAVQMAYKEKPGSLIVGRRWDLKLTEHLDFSVRWEKELLKLLARKGKVHAETAIDYFVFPKGLWNKIPPFALGRTMWDNWLIYSVRSRKIPVTDLSAVTTVIHQNHGYEHYPGGEEALWLGEEARNNRELGGGYGHAYDLRDTTHKLTKKGLKRKFLTPLLSSIVRAMDRYFPQAGLPKHTNEKVS
jgi:hypothetical protein